MTQLEHVTPSLMRLELPSQTLPPFTHTNTYLIHDGSVGVLVDPGFHEASSMAVVETALAQTGVKFLKAILLTHTHQDHVWGIGLVRERFAEAPVYVHPYELARLEQPRLQALNENRTLMVGSKAVNSVFTPGHSPGHLSFYLPDEATALVGDLVAGHGSTWIGVPEGDIADYLQSIDTLGALKLKQLGPGHGALIHEPYNKLNEARQHRLERLEQVVAALSSGNLNLSELRKAIYPEVPAELERFSEYSLLALLKKLMHDMRVLHLGKDENGPYALRR